MTSPLPPVAANAAAEATNALPPRLRKRLEVTAAKARTWDATRDGNALTLHVDADTTVTLTLSPTGTITTADAVTCTCLLAPACLHRAAVLAAAPLAEADTPAAEPAEPEPAPTAAPGAARAARAAHALWTAAVAALEAGARTSALPRTGLLHAAHTARLAGLHRPAATATRVARRLTEAADADSAFRLADLTDDLAALLGEARAVRDAPDSAAAREAAGTARRTYRAAGSLRLYGLFTEPVVTASGYAGATAYLATPDGEFRTVAVVAPGGPERVAASAAARVPGGAALTLRELGRGGGLIATGATVTEDGRIGGGAGLRSVAAPGAGWDEAPFDALWARPVDEQIRTALAWRDIPVDQRPAGGDLLFLTGTVTVVAGRPALALSTGESGGGPAPVLHAPDERPELAYAENLRLLIRHAGARVRVVGRLAADRPTGLTALALSLGGTPFHLGLDRLPPGPPPSADPPPGVALALPPVEWDLLNRTVGRAVAGGRAVAAAAVDPALPARLRAAGLPTAADCAAALAATARARRPDALGAMLPADPDAFALAWLAAAVYVRAAAREFTATAWTRHTSLTV
ncbi:MULTISPECIES: hypothetical protein [unclassified Streptomyces]|uniref:hypothetical protein n=1 Tax=unclassified Streptomyces TaxID=2593676 RepID=UPI002E2C03F2|nr:hypothetical protein [Streptomyces sp. NBC_00223]